MGWVSCIEDAVARLASELRQIRTRQDDETDARELSAERESVGRLIGTCERILRDITGHLELATDPTLDLADRVQELAKKVTVLKEQATHDKQELQKALSELARTRSDLEKVTTLCKQTKDDLFQTQTNLGKSNAKYQEMARQCERFRKEHQKGSHKKNR